MSIMDRDKDQLDEHSDFDSFMTNWSSPDLDDMSVMKENDEEFAAEFAYADPNLHASSEAGRNYNESIDNRELDEVDASEANQALGWAGLVFAIASWFIWPLIMGVVAIVLGIMAYRSNSRTLGGWAIGLGAATLAFNLVVVPLYYSFIA